LIDAVGADGKVFALEVAIGVPFLSERSEAWACTLTLSPLLSKPVDICGEDSLQALCLALRMARSMLDDFSEKGGRLLADGEPFPIDAYFGAAL
jgi:hypothetical protein